MIDPVIFVSINIAFVLLFLASVIGKYRDFEVFQALLANYQLVPVAASGWAAKAVVAAETGVVLFFLTPLYSYGLILAASILCVYAVAIAINVLRGRTHIDCGCLGSEGHGISGLLVARNVVLLAFLALCLLPHAQRALIWLDYATIGAFVVCSVLAYLTANRLIEQTTQQRLWWSS